MPEFEMDFVVSDPTDERVIMAEVAGWIQSHNPPADLTDEPLVISVVNMLGPGGGWPVVRIVGCQSAVEWIQARYQEDGNADG